MRPSIFAVAPDESDTEDSDVEEGIPIRDVLQSAFRLTQYHITRAAGRSEDEWPIVLTVGGIGALCGSMVRRQMGKWVFYVTSGVFLFNLAVHLGVIQINQEQVARYEQMVPVNVRTFLDKLKAYALTLPMGGVLSSGFLIGFNYL